MKVKPVVEIKERSAYDIITINFANGGKISIQTTENGFEVNNNTTFETTMYIKPSMGNVFEVLTVPNNS